jgi:hypothetical protein
MVQKERYVTLVEPQRWESHYQYNWTTDPTPGVISKGVSLPIRFLETTVSSGHPGFSTPGSQDVGGDFSTIKVRSIVNHTPGIFNGALTFGSRYIGPAWPDSPTNIGNYAKSLVPFSSDASLMQKGTTAIARCLPTNPIVDGATAIGELRKGIPKLIGKELFKSHAKDYRKYGSEYVNFEFGWKPIVSDLMKTVQAVSESEKILTQLHRDSGRNVRRKYAFPDEVATTSWTVGNIYSYLPGGIVLSTQQYDGPGTATVTQKITTRTWFKGCFTYHLNLGTTLPDRLMAQAADARKLYGLELTPEVAWNLAPWSWALDWEGTIGDVLHNAGRFAQDGLVMRYGYIMQTKTAEVDIVLHRGAPVQQGMNNGPLHMTVTAESLVRRRATPFGFGFDMTALNGRQVAILGALGMSRGPRI